MARLAAQLTHQNGHKSYPQAPALCLTRFDELMAIELEVFTKQWDPYWDVPLNESLPVPVIELPAAKETSHSYAGAHLNVCTTPQVFRGS